MGPFTHIKRKTEDALENVVDDLAGTGFTNVTFYKGFSLSELLTPRVQFLSETATPERIGETNTGNFVVDVIMAVVSNKADHTRGQHATWCGLIEDIIMRDDMENLLNTIGDTNDFFAFTPGWIPGSSTDSIENDTEIVTSYAATLYCRPSTPS